MKRRVGKAPDKHRTGSLFRRGQDYPVSWSGRVFKLIPFYLFLGLLTLSNCRDEDKVGPQISFDKAASAVTEGDEMAVDFNIPLPKDVTPVLTFSGTAKLDQDFTYEVRASGIDFVILKDKARESQETIVVTISRFSGNARIGGIKTHTIAIDDLVLPVVEFSAKTSNAAEGGTQLVPFKNPLPAGIEPVLAFLGSATKDSDYTYSVSPDGIVIVSKDDAVYDPNETIIISLKSAGENAEVGVDSVHTVTLTESPVILEFAAASSSVQEGSADVIIPFSKTLPVQVVPTVLVEGTALEGTDFTYSIGPTGIVLKTIGDQVYDPDETLSFTLTGASGNAVVGGLKKHTITISELPLTVEFAAASSVVQEGSAEVTIPFMNILPGLVVPTVVLEGTAVEGTDFTYTLGTTGIVLKTIGDQVYDPNETLSFTLTGVSGNAALGDVKKHTVTISEEPLAVEFQGPSSVLAEGASGTVPFTFSLPAGVTPRISIAGTATEGTDYSYTLSAQGLSFVTQKDGISDDDETIVITITGADGNALVGTNAVHTLTLTDSKWLVEFKGTSTSIAEGGNTLLEFVTQLPPEIIPVVSVTGTASAGSDFTYSVSGSGVAISSVADGQYDPNETIEVTLTSPGGNGILGSAVTHTVVLTEIPLSVEFAAGASSVTEGGAASAAFNIPLPAGVNAQIAVEGTATQGTDFTYSVGPNGVTVNVVDDGVFDPDETVILNISGVSGNTVPGNVLRHTVTIAEPAVVLEFLTKATALSEGDGLALLFRNPLPTGLVPSVTIGGTGTQETDFSYSVTSAGLVFTTVSDGLYDPDETILVTLTGVGGNAVLGSTVSHLITITETPIDVAFASASSTLGEGGSGTVSYTVALPTGVDPVLSFGGTATESSDYSYTVTKGGVTISAVADGIYDPDETVTITIVGTTGNAVLGAVTTHTVTISEPRLVVELLQSSSSSQEGAEGSVNLNMELPVGVEPTFAFGGTAAPGVDYTYLVTQGGVLFTAIDDGVYDPNETIVITLTGVTGNTVLGGLVSHTVTISEQPLPIGFLSASSALSEGAGSTVTYSISLPTGAVPNVVFQGTATSGTDYSYVLTDNGIDITAVADGIYDPNETIVITVSGVGGNSITGGITTHTLTITEPPLIIEFASSSGVAAEGSASSVNYSIPLPIGVTASLAFGGSATQGTDYTLTQNQSGIQISVTADGLYDPDETILITLTGATGNTVLGSRLTHTITITEPKLVVEFTTSASSLAEAGSTAIPYNIGLPAGVTPTVSLGGTATQGTDYTFAVTQTGVSISPVADGLYDPNETVIVTLTGVSGNALVGTVKTHTITLTEPALLVEFAAATSILGEGNAGSVPYNIVLPAGVTPSISLGGTATQGTDFNLSITQTGISISPIADGLYDPNESIIINLTGVSGNAVLGGAKTHTVTLTEPPLVVEFTAASSSLGEGNSGKVSYNLTLPAGVTTTVSVSGTATQGTDYTFNNSQTGINITTTADGLYDPNETVVLTLTAVTGNAVLGTVVTHTITLTEPALVVEFGASASSLGESAAGNVSYNIVLPTGVTPTVSLAGTATQGADFTFAITQSGISITPVADGLYDPNETIVFTLTGVSGNAVLGAVKTHTVTLTEPPLVVEFTAASSSLGESASGSVPYTITLPTGVTPVVSVGGTATQGTDYSYAITQAGISITPVADGLYDPNETIIITLTSVSGNAVLGTVKTHTVTLTEPPLVVEFAAATSSQAEGTAATIPYNITLPTGVLPTVSFGGTATQGTDFTFSITPAGISITPVADGLYDPNETISITLTSVSGNAVPGTVKTHTVTLTEPPLTVQFAAASSTAGEGNSGNVIYNINLPAGVTPTVSVGGTATQGTDYSYTITQTGISFTTVADGLYDPNETIVFTLTGVSGNAVLGAVKTHTITLTEPPLVVEFAGASSSLGESSAGAVPFNITLPAGVLPTITVGGTAAVGTDYTYTTTQTGISITPVADGFYDPNETIVITLTAVSGNAVLGTIKTHTVTLTEPPLSVEFNAASSTLEEGASGNIPFSFTLPAGVTPTTAVGGTATEGADFAYTITPSGISITPVADGLYDPNETVTFTLTNVTGNAVLGSVVVHTVTLTEPALVVEFAAASSSLGEGNSEVVPYNIALPSGVLPTVTVGGSAVQGSDYTYSVTPDGISVSAVADGLYDPNETIIITLTGVSGNAVLGVVKTHTITLTEPALVVEFDASASTFGEGDAGDLAYNILLPAGVAPTIALGGTATEGADYTYSITQAGISITTVADGIYDPNETIVLTLTSVSGNAVLGTVKTHTVTLTEPQLVVEFAGSASSLAEAATSGNVPYSFTLPTGVTPTVTVGGTATLNTDYTYTITQTGITITPVADGLYDPNETIVLTLTGVSGNAVLGTVKTHTVTLTEPQLVVEFAGSTSSLAEAATSVIVPYSFTLPTGVIPAVTVGGTATLNTDYTFTITQTGITITPVGDGIYDPNETIVLTLTNVSGNAVLGTVKTHTVTLTEPQLVVEYAGSISSLAEAATSGSVPYTFTLPTGVTPTLTAGGTATLNTDYTYTVTQTGITITPVPDGLYDPNETIVITLTGVSGNAVLGTVKTHTVTLTEPQLVVEFAGSTSALAEAAASGSVPYTFTLPAGVTPTVTTGGTATLNTDYTYTITQTGITITPVQDGLYDPNESIVLTLTGVSGNAVLGTVKTHTVTLTEPQLVVEFAGSASTLAEAATSGSVPYTFALPAGVTPAVTTGGTATLNTDYTYTITQSGITITPVADGLYDPNETIVLTLTNVSGNAVLGTVKTHTVTLTEPQLVVEFAGSASSLAEGTAGSVPYTFTLPTGVTPTVTAGGTATQGTDYTYTVTQTGITITPVADGLYDPNETIVFTLTSVSGNAVVGTVKTHTVTLTEPQLVVEFAGSISSLAEAALAGSVPYTFTLPTGVTPTVTAGGTATEGTDYTYAITQTGITITPVADGLYDPNETIVLTLTGVSGNAVLGTVKTHTVTLTEPLLVVEFAGSSSSLAEASSSGSVPYTFSLPTGVTPTVTTGGTATLNTDYTFAITQTGITITPVADGLYDPNETIVLTLTNVSGNAVLGTVKTHTVTLTEPQLVVEFTGSTSSLAETAASGSVPYTFNLPSGVTPTVTAGGTATLNTDYTYTITQTGITITPVADGLYDPNETIVLTLTNVSGNAVLGTVKTHTVTLTEPQLVVEFAGSASSLAEGTAGSVPYTFTLPTGVTPTVTAGGTATQGTDYTYTVTQTGITITPVADGLYDPNETIVLTLTSVSGNAVVGTVKTHTVTLTEPQLVVEFATASSSAPEGAGTLASFISRSPQEVVASVEFSGTATPGADYTYTVTQDGVSIDLVNDGIYDPDETVIVTLTGVTGNAVLGSVSTQTITITEEPLIVEFASDVSTVQEGSGSTVPFNIILPLDVVPVLTFGGTATQGTDYSYTFTPTGVAITAIADGTYDPDETIIITITDVTGNAQQGTLATHTVALTEPKLIIEFAASASSLAEGTAGSVPFTFTLPAGVTATVTAGGSATEGTDYTYTITQTGMIITPVEDGLYDPNETILLTLTSVSGNAVLGTVTTHTVTLTEPQLVVEFAGSASALAEAATSGSVSYTFTLPTGVTPTVTAGGTATEGTDYTYSITQAGITITPAADGLYDPNETILITLAGVSGNAVLGTVTTHTVTLTEPQLVVEVAGSTSSLTEGIAGSVPYTFTLPTGVTPMVTAGGTATQGIDYTYTVTQTGITITPVADGLYDPNETIVLTLTSISGNAVLGSENTHTVTLTEPQLVVEFAGSISSLAEAATSGSVPYTFTLPTGVIPTITVGGTATEGTDYTYAITQTGITITPVADGLYDPNETIVLTLTEVSGNAALGTVTMHTVTITEPPVIVEFAELTSSLPEGAVAGNVLYTIALPSGVVPSVAVDGTATLNTDYTYTVTQTGITISPVADDLVDPNETIIITLTSSAGNAILGASTTHTLTLVETALVVEFASAGSAIGEGTTSDIPFNITLPTSVIPEVITGGTATLNTDYTYTVTQAGITVTPLADGLYDPDETIIITLTNVSGNAVLGTETTHTIALTEPPLVVEFAESAQSLPESSGFGSIPYTFMLPEGVTSSITVGGTATQGVDYTYSVTQDGINITPVADGFYDPNETIIITLTAVSGNTVLGAVKTHTVTLTEPQLVVEFAGSSSLLAEGTAGNVPYTFTLPAEVLPVVTFGGTAIEGTDYTYSITQTGVNITPIADGLYDPNETVIITMTGVTGNSVLGTVVLYIITLTEPQLVVEFAESASLLSEGTSSVIPYAFTLPTGVTPNVTIGGTAAEGTDYTYTITQTGINITLAADGSYDPNETIIITLTEVSGNAVLGAGKTHTVTLTEPELVVEFAGTGSSLAEGTAGSVPYMFTLPTGVMPTVSVGGTAALNTDYTYTITQTGISITPVADGLYDPNETIIITLTGVSGNAVLGMVTTHTVTLTEPPLTVEFRTTSSSLAEGTAGNVQYNITLPTGVIPAISLGGTAAEGTDYTYTITQTGISISPVADGLYDPNETIVMTLTSVSGNTVLGTLKTHTVTLTEPPLVVEFAGSASSVAESASGNVPYNILLPAGVTPTVSVGGTATQGTDYTYTITQTGISITPVADVLYDPNETIVITLTAVSGNAVLGTVKTHTVTLTEPQLVVEFAGSASSLEEEAADSVPYTFTLPTGVTPAVTVGGTATQGTDYTYSVTQTGISITPVADGLYDPNETIIITLTSVSGNAVLGTVKTHTVTLTEPPLVVEFAVPVSSLEEGTAGSVPYTITLPAGVTPAVTVGGTATQGTDYSYTITQTAISITPVADGLYDPNETIVITLTGATGNTVLGAVKTHTITLTEPPLVVEFALSSSALGEGNEGDLPYNITLPDGVTPIVAFSGTAEQGADYTYAITQNGITINVTADALYEPGEAIVVTLTGVSGNAVIGTMDTHTIMLTEPALVVEFSTSASTINEVLSGAVLFNLPFPSEVVPTITFGGTATQGIDYDYSLTSEGISITAAADAIYDPDETVVITLTGATGNSVLGSVLTHTVTLTENILELEFSSASSTVAEGDAGNAEFTFALPDGVLPSLAIGGTATQGIDYTYSITPAGITVTTVNDGLYDPNETIIITLTGISVNIVPGTVITHTITVSEPVISVEFAAETSSISEGNSGDVSYTIPLPDGVTPIISVGGTATSGSDYTYSVTSAGIAVTTVDDGFYDPNETIIFTLTGASGNAAIGTIKTHTVTLPEPALTVEFESPSSGLGEGNSTNILYTTILPGGVLPNISLSGSATEGTDYTYSVTPTGIVVEALADGSYDPNETIILTLTGVSGNAVIGTLNTHTITLTEPELVVEFSAASSSVAEGIPDTVRYSFTLPAGVTPALSLGGTATEGTDYIYTLTSSGVSITPAADGVFDPNETIIITLTGVSGNAVLGAVEIHTVTITEPAINVEFAASASALGEDNSGTVNFITALPAGVTPTISVGGTATLDTDYTYTLTQTGISIAAVSDGIYDPNETIIITLTGVTGNAELGAVVTHTVTLTEPPLVVEFIASSSVLNEGSSGTVLYNLTLPTGVTPEVTLGGTATQGIDYTYLITETGITVSSLADGLYEPGETIIITLTSLSGNAVPGTAITHTISLSEPPLVVQFAVSSSNLGEGNTGTVAYNINLPAGVVPSVSLGGSATLGSDYTYTITQTGISVTVIADGVYDPSETLVITLTDVSGNAVLGSVLAHTINLTEPALVVEFTSAISSISETSSGKISFNTNLPSAVTPTITVGGTATLGVDYTYTVTSSGINVASVADAVYEGNETVIFTIASVTGNAVLGTIKTNTLTLIEPPLVVEFSAASSPQEEGVPATISYNQVLPAGVTPTVSVAGTATLGTDYTYTITQSGVVVNSVADGVYDPNETVIINMTSISGNAVRGTIRSHTLTLTEPPLMVDFTSTASSVVEGSPGTILFNLTLPAGVTPVITFGGTATAGTDYNYTVSQTGVSITTTADGQYDPNETIFITISSLSGNAVPGTAATHTVTLTEPPLVVQFASSASAFSEGNSSTIAFNQVLPAGVTPTISLGGTATPGTDYTYVIDQNGITVTSIADGLYEPNETVEITLTGVSGNAGLGTVITHTITINEPALVVQFATAGGTLVEGAVYTVAFTTPLPPEVVPSVSISGTATQTTDYSYEVTSSGVVISAVAEEEFDPDETVIVTLTGITGNSVLGTVTSSTVLITEAPLVAEFQFDASVLQEGGSSTILFTRTLPAGVTPVVSVSGTATQGSDFSFTVAQNGIVVNTIPDVLYEPGETIILTITGVGGNASLGTILTHTITLTEPPLNLEFAVSSSAITEGQSGSVQLNMSLPQEVVPAYSFGGTATPGVDYTYTTTPDGIQLTVAEEWLADPDETVVITLQSVTGNAQTGALVTHTVTLTDPSAQTGEFASASSALGEGQTSVIPFSVPLPVGTVPTLSASGSATEGIDYTYTVSSDGITMITAPDAVLDANETVLFTITGFNNNAGEFGNVLIHTVTISDVPFPVQFAATSSSIEEGGVIQVPFAMTLPAGITPVVSFGGAATAGTDYTYEINGAGLTISTLEEWRFDPNETIIITLTGANANTAVGAPAVHTVTITDIQGQTVEFSSAASNATEGQTQEVTFNAALPAGITPSVSLGGTATLEADYTYTVSPTGISFNLIRDAVLDANETISVTLTEFNGNTVELGNTITHVITISDLVNTIEFTAAASALEEGSSGTVGFVIPIPPGVTATVAVSGTATLNSDYTYSVTADGVVVNALEEWAFDPNETVIITLTGFTGNALLGPQAVHTLTLTDPPSQVVQFTSAASVVTEGQNVLIPFNAPLAAGLAPTVTLSGTAGVEVDFFYTISSAGITIYTAGDGDFDVDETVTVTMTGFNLNSAELGTSVTHTVTITDTPMVIGFQTVTSRRVEGFSVVVAFTQPLPPGVVPAFAISGTASTDIDYIYTQNQNGLIVTTKKDLLYDPEETVIIQLAGFTGNVIPGGTTLNTLTIEDEDEKQAARMVVGLTWNAGNGTMGDVDMDLLVWYESAPGSYTLKFLSDNTGQVAESVSIPSNEVNGRWGASYVYYSGSSANMNFTVNFRLYKGNISLATNRATYNATYTLVNRNPWDQTQIYRIEQNFNKSGNDYNTFTGITVPSSRSREAALEFLIDKTLIRSKRIGSGTR